VETEPQIVKDYIASGKVKLIYRHLLQLGDGSVRTAEASECAADQGKFWTMHNTLYARQSEVYRASDLDTTLAGFAKDLQLDEQAFGACMATNKQLKLVQDDYEDSKRAGVQFRPVFDINGTRITGAQPFTVFKQQIDAAPPK
jgi:protein-disulfide isomerase